MAAEPLNDNWTMRLINSFLCITFYFEFYLHVIKTDVLTSVLRGESVGAKIIDR